MTRLAVIAALLLTASSAFAQDDDPERGLVEGHLVGDQSPTAAPVLRPQLVHHDHTTPIVIGASLTIAGTLSLIGGWSLYVARQNFRERYWSTLSDDTIGTWRDLGAWSFWMTGAGASMLVAGEYLLLPESRDVPVLAWLAGAGGVTLAAVGIGFAAGGQHCGPQKVSPGADLLLACDSGTADALFGPALILSSLALVNVPLVYLLRKAFAGAPESLSFGPGSVSLTGRF